MNWNPFRRSDEARREKARATAQAKAQTLIQDGYKFSAVPPHKGRVYVWKPGQPTKPAYTLDLLQTGLVDQPYRYRCSCHFFADEQRLTGEGWCKHGMGFLLDMVPRLPIFHVMCDAPLAPDYAKGLYGRQQCYGVRGGMVRGVGVGPIRMVGSDGYGTTFPTLDNGGVDPLDARD